LSEKNNNIQKTSLKSVDKFRIITEDPKLKKFLNETLETQDFRKKKKENKKISKIEATKIKNNDDKKVGILDKHIFGSMANLIYFFKFMLRHPELIDRFGEDIEELLGLKEDTISESKFQVLGFSALVNLILNYPSQNPDESLNDNRFSFKRHLLPILQDSIYHHIIDIFRHRQHDMIFRMMVDNDFQRAKTWTEYIDEKPKHAHKSIGRKIIMSEGVKKR
jgi:hypothetical protein